MNKEMTLKEAKELSILKWKAVVGFMEEHKCYPDQRDFVRYSPDVLDKIEYLKNNCGFCEKYLDWYKNDGEKTSTQCIDCPINMGIPNGCYNSLHLHHEANSDGNLESAKKLLALIESIVVPEEENKGLGICVDSPGSNRME